jgi:oxalate decarboxylase/phosphoglucose isomerase-like protein (cupin superfamily)
MTEDVVEPGEFIYIPCSEVHCVVNEGYTEFGERIFIYPGVAKKVAAGTVFV